MALGKGFPLANSRLMMMVLKVISEEISARFETFDIFSSSKG